MKNPTKETLAAINNAILSKDFWTAQELIKSAKVKTADEKATLAAQKDILKTLAPNLPKNVCQVASSISAFNERLAHYRQCQDDRCKVRLAEWNGLKQQIMVENASG